MRVLSRNAVLGVGLAALSSAAYAQVDAAQTLQEAESRVAGLHQQFDQAAEAYTRVYNDARSVRIDVAAAFSSNANLNPVGPPQSFGQLTRGDMLEYMPHALIDDVNRRIYREYIRGFYEWEQGAYPPMRYLVYDSRDIYGNYVWVHSLYDQWNSDSVFLWNYPTSVWGLYIDKRGGRGSGGDISSQYAQLGALGEAATRAIAQARTYRPQVQVRRFLPDVWTNKGDWQRLEAAVNSAMSAYRNALDRIRVNVDSESRFVVEKVVRYERGRDNMPVIEFLLLSRMMGGTGTGHGDPGFGGLQGGTGNGYNDPHRYRPGYGISPPRYLTGDRLLDWYFDNLFFSSIPEEYQTVIERKFALAYFRGAYDAKYDNRIQSSSGTGSGWSYNWGSDWGSSGTGDGYSYGGNRYRTGSGRRTRGAASTGDGSSTGGQGTGGGTNQGTGGTGGGYNQGTGGTGGGTPTYRPPQGGTGGGTSQGTGGTGGGTPTYRPPQGGTGGGTSQGTGGTGGGQQRPTGGTGTGTGS